MEVFIVVLVMLVLIGVSNVIYRYVPFVPVPLIQIALGACIAILPLGMHLPLEPELFFILFIAPLLYNDGKHTPREELWRLRAPILLLSVGLVFATVFVVGYTIHWMIPSIPPAAAFGLAAILSPTDAVAVGALAGRIHLPKSLMRLLEGEALMNDASGLVAFKFAIAAAVTGVFSLQKATFSFLLIAVGGLLVGALLAFLIIGIRQMLRRAGLEDETMHMLLQILTPFLLYLVAEEIGVSGILAAVAGGIVHAVESERLEHAMPKLKSVSNNTWSVILFILNGLVFVILGVQIPDVTAVIFNDPHFNNYEVLGYAVVIFVLLLVLRFVWTFLFTRAGRWFGGSAGEEASSLKVLLLTTISGVRGAVTLAGAFSIPLLLQSGDLFPQRDLMIFLAACVILFSLLTASILLPLIAKKRVTTDEVQQAREARQWQIKVMKAAMRQLQQESNEVNEAAIESVISEYRMMIQQLGMTQTKPVSVARQEEVAMRIVALNIERKYVSERLEQGAISQKHADFYFTMLDQVELILANRLHLGALIFKRLWRRIKATFSAPEAALASFTEKDVTALRSLKLQCSEAVISEMGPRCTPDMKGDPTEWIVAYYNQVASRLKTVRRGSPKKDDRSFDECRRELHWMAVQAERDEVQHLYERGEIDRALAAELRRAIREREATMFEQDELG